MPHSETPTTPSEITRRKFLGRGAALSATAATTASGLTVLSGCGGKGGTSNSSDELTFWQFYGPGGNVKSQSKWFEDVAKGWNKEHKTKVKLNYVPTNEYTNGSKLQTAFSSGKGPDIFLISPGDFLRYYNGGVLEELGQYMSKEAREDFYSNVMGTRIVDDKIYALPMEVEPMAMFYSVKAFEKAGLSESDVPETWDELLSVAEKLKAKNKSMFGVEFETNTGYYQNFTWYPFMWQGGADITAANGKSSDFDSKGAIRALKFWQDTVSMGLAPKKTQGTGTNEPSANLAAEYCAIQNCGIFGVSDMKENKPKFEYGVFKLPLPSGGKSVTSLGGWAFVANSKGKNPEEAAKFCVWALGSMEKDSIQRVVDWNIKSKSDIAPRKTALKEATKQGGYDSGPMKTFKEDIFPNGRPEPRLTSKVYKPISDAIQSCQLEKASPKKEAQKAAHQIDSVLKSYSGAEMK